MHKFNAKYLIMKTVLSSTILAAPFREEVKVQERQIPTYVYASVFASLCIAVGLIWDISWHMTVGRDGLFSPPHIAIYLGAVIAGVFSGIKVLKTSFWGSPEEKASSIHFWKVFYGSFGAMFCIWGAFAMLTSAPFDDWWHNTYGLDVKILSPPHALLAMGMVMIQFGALVSVTSLQNRLSSQATEKTSSHLQWMYAMSAGFLLVMVFVIISEYFFLMRQHDILAYQIAAGVFPLLMVAVAYAAPYNWAATKMAVAYTLLLAAMVWILPLFPAEPKLSPIRNFVTVMQPYEFPLMLIAPALVIDFFLMKFGQINKWALAALLGLGFVLVFLPVQWYFAEFLTTEAARGWFFGRFSWTYASDPDFPYRYTFHPRFISTGIDLIKGAGIAVIIGLFSSRIALSWGNWMKRIKR
ncbi:hypothetical protein CLW00_10749 [Mongoliibacter ruber]|uniref:Uncharacterized protein n=2 Tax=Mongoliibacter ruber TaxID=1750599 RepID=A0A2T0WJU9_9BACT|nr:hypothetical protein CLW00_10749 [Mongoliibacter ruber]